MNDLQQRIASLSPEQRKLLELWVRQEAEQAALKQQEQATAVAADSDPGAPPRAGYTAPLSLAQQRLWLLDQLQPNSPFYNMPFALRLTGPLDVDVLHRCLGAIVQRHDSLRTTFTSIGGEPQQVIAPELELPLPLDDLRDMPEAAREAEVLRRARADARSPFDLVCGPLLRASLLRLGDQQHILLLTMHHIISDGWSTGVLMRELIALYMAFAAGSPSPLPDLPLQYAEFARWQREWLQGEHMETQLAYWRAHLAGAPPVLELPTDRPRPPVQTFQGAKHWFRLPATIVTGSRALLRDEGCTLFMALLAAFQIVLSRYSGQGDIVVGTPIAGRTRSDVEGLIGLFANTLALRTKLSDNPTFRAVLRRVREVALEAYAHQDLPFERLIDELQPARDLSRTPIFQVLFAFQNMPVPELRGAALRMQRIEVETEQSRMDVMLFMRESAEGLTGSIEYATELFDQATIERMLGTTRSC